MSDQERARAADRLTATDPVEILQQPTTGKTVKGRPAKRDADEPRDIPVAE
jgi:hypothetical protein